jgi:hypothetical protein
MAETQRAETLAVECRIFTRYLISADAPSDVVAAYQRAHDVSAVEAGGVSRSLDRALLRVAHAGPGFARAADGYAAAFAKASLLRRKLVLLLAILESRGSTAATLDTAAPGSSSAWIAEIGLRVGAFALTVCMATLLVAPLRIWYSVVGRTRGV